MKKAYNVVINLLLCVAGVLAVLLVGVRLVGIKPYVVLSSSMEPAYPVGSLVYVVEAEAEDFKVGEPITFDMDGNTVTHRIIEVNNDPSSGLTFRTQGDANNLADGKPVAPQQILGKPAFCIPVLGYVSYFLLNPPGLYAAIGICVILILLALAADVIFSKTDDKEPESSE